MTEKRKHGGAGFGIALAMVCAGTILLTIFRMLAIAPNGWTIVGFAMIAVGLIVVVAQMVFDEIRLRSER